MPRFPWRELTDWLGTLENYAYTADIHLECDTKSNSAVLSVVAFPLLVEGMSEDPEDCQPIGFKILAIEPYRCETKLKNLEIDFIDNGIAFRSDDPALWNFEDKLDIICDSPVDCEKLFWNVVARMDERATVEDIIRYIYPWPKLDPPFMLGQFPETLFHEVREALKQMHVAIFVPAEPQPRERPIMLEIVDEVRIIAKDFEVEIPVEKDTPPWFRRR